MNGFIYEANKQLQMNVGSVLPHQPLLPSPLAPQSVTQKGGGGGQQDKLNLSFGEKNWLNSSMNEKNWFNNSFNLNSSLNLPPELRYKSLNEMVGKITDEDLLAASSSGNSGTLNFSALKNFNSQQKHNNHNNQNQLYRQDSNSSNGGYEPIYTQLFEQPHANMPTLQCEDFSKNNKLNQIQQPSGGCYSISQQNNYFQQPVYQPNQQLFETQQQQQPTQKNEIKTQSYIPERPKSLNTAPVPQLTPPLTAKNPEKMSLAFPPTYGHHLAKLTADQQSYLLQQQCALVLTMDRISSANASVNYTSSNEQPLRPSLQQHFSSSSSSSVSSHTSSNTSPLINTIIKLQTSHQNIDNLQQAHVVNPDAKQQQVVYLNSPIIQTQPTDNTPVKTTEHPLNKARNEFQPQNVMLSNNNSFYYSQSMYSQHQRQQQPFFQYLPFNPINQQIDNFLMQQNMSLYSPNSGFSPQLKPDLNINYPTSLDSRLLPNMIDANGNLLAFNMNNEKVKYFIKQSQQQPSQQQQPYRQHRRTGPANELHIRLEECFYQFKCLETERKKFEADLSQMSLNHRFSNLSNPNSKTIMTVPTLPRLPSNPSRVDRLIFDYIKEYGRIVNLLQKIENLKNTIFYESIQFTFQKWLDGIKNVQTHRKNELVNKANRQRLCQTASTESTSDEKDVTILASSINELSFLTKKARTSLWCAMQISNVNYKQSNMLAESFKSPSSNVTNSDSLLDSVEKTQEFIHKTFEIKTDLVNLATKHS